MQELVVEMVIAYLELGYPLPVDMYVRLRNEGIDVDYLISKHTI